MALPGSGSISLSQMRDEYGLGNPVSFSAMRGRGAAPGSGPMSFSQLLSASNVVFLPSNSSIVLDDDMRVGVTLSCTVPAVWTYAQSGAGGTVSIGSGATANSAYFEATSTVSGVKSITRTSSWTVTATAGDKTMSWSIRLTAQANV